MSRKDVDEAFKNECIPHKFSDGALITTNILTLNEEALSKLPPDVLLCSVCMHGSNDAFALPYPFAQGVMTKNLGFKLLLMLCHLYFAYCACSVLTKVFTKPML